jgi:hypothetical protein
MEHFQTTEQVNRAETRRARRRPKARWLAMLGAGAFAAMLVPITGSLPGHAATEAPEGLLCDANATSSFVLKAQAGYILTPDNNSIYMWSYSAGGKPFQYPGTTLCVTEGDDVTITLKNTLEVPTSIVFPGITGVQADGALAVPQAGTDSLTKQAEPGQSVTYTFTADHAGTYLYESGTNTQLQAQMGLVGALVVRPIGFNPDAPHVYNLAGGNDPDLDTNYKPGKEFLNLFSEVDPDLHQKVEFAPDQAGYVVDWNAYRARYWMINGRVFPDTIGANNSQSFPAQPYSALVHIQPRDAGNPLPALVRMLNAGSRTYPFHPHGNHDKLIGIDGRPLRSIDGSLDFTRDEFGRVMVPGQTSEVLVTWVDAQGFATNDIGVPVPPDLGRENGAYWSGSPYLGEETSPKAFEVKFNECGEYYHMAHSHALYQVATYSASGSGMLTFTRIDPPAPNDTNCHPAGEQ